MRRLKKSCSFRDLYSLSIPRLSCPIVLPVPLKIPPSCGLYSRKHPGSALIMPSRPSREDATQATTVIPRGARMGSEPGIKASAPSPITLFPAREADDMSITQHWALEAGHFLVAVAAMLKRAKRVTSIDGSEHIEISAAEATRVADAMEQMGVRLEEIFRKAAERRKCEAA